LKTTSKLLFCSILILLCIEFTAIIIAPLIVPPQVYLKHYLKEGTQKSTIDFLNNESLLIPDEATGWRSHPNVKMHNWETDQYGSRSNSSFSSKPSNKSRVIFLGSSMINGGTGVTNGETISAYVDSQNIETLNFGTMLFSLDQSFQLLKEISRYKPTTVILGLDSDPISGLTSMYVPFRDRRETNIPFLKPRFVFDESGELKIISIKPGNLVNIFTDRSILRYLEKFDRYHENFNYHSRFGYTPLAAGLNAFLKKGNKFLKYQNGDPEGERIFFELIKKAHSFAKKNQINLILLSMPAAATMRSTGIRQYFTDHYTLRLKKLDSLNYRVIDAKEIFEQSNVSISELFSEDGVHFTAFANKLIAKHLTNELPNIEPNID